MKAISRPCRIAFVLAGLSLPGACAAVDAVMGGGARYTPLDKNERFEERADIAVRNEAGDLDPQRFVRIGSVAARERLRRCDNAPCSVSKRGDQTPSVIEEARRAGGDIIVLSARNAVKFESGNRNGACLSYSTSTSYQTRWYTFDGYRRSESVAVQRRICRQFQQIPTYTYYQESAGIVYRDDPALARQRAIRAAEQRAAAERARAEAEALAAARAAEEAARRRLEDRRIALLQSGSYEEVRSAIARDAAMLTARYPADFSQREGGVDALTLAVYFLNPAGVQALLDAGMPPDAGGFGEDAANTPPPLWLALQRFWAHSECRGDFFTEEPDYIIKPYRTAAGDSFAKIIFGQLLKAGADAATPAPKFEGSHYDTLYFGVGGGSGAASRSLLSAAATIRQCQIPGEQTDMVRMILERGGTPPAVLSQIRSKLSAMVADYEQRLAPSWRDSVRNARTPADRSFAEKRLRAIEGALNEARGILAVLSTQS